MLGFDFCSSGMSCEARRGGVSGGRNGQLLQTEMVRHGYSGGESARLERAGRVQAFIFYEDVGILTAGEHRSESFAERNRIGLGKNGVVAPHGGRAPSEAGGRKAALDRGEIVARVENASIFGANRLRPVRGIVLGAAGTFEVRQTRHGRQINICARECGLVLWL